MKAYPVEFRQRVVELHRQGWTTQEIRRALGVSRAWVDSVKRLHAAGKPLAIKSPANRRTSLAGRQGERLKARDGALTGPHFLGYLRQVLRPELNPGDVVVMDNLRTHKLAGVASLLAERGARALYLPPYSPDFNPIEQAFSQVKARLRRERLRTVEELWGAFGRSLDWVTPSHAANYFRDAGYSPE